MQTLQQIIGIALVVLGGQGLLRLILKGDGGVLVNWMNTGIVFDAVVNLLALVIGIALASSLARRTS